MSDIEITQKIAHKITELSPEQLSIVNDFSDSLPIQNNIQSPLRRLAPVKRRKTASELLKFAGTWQGDDLEDCLQFVRETRSKSQF